MKKRLLAALTVTTLAAAPAATAQQAGHDAHHGAAPAAAARSATGTGIVQKLDAAKGEVTLKHGPLPPLNMPAMTMSFPVKDRASLAQLKPLQKVEFDVAFDGKAYLITRIK